MENLGRALSDQLADRRVRVRRISYCRVRGSANVHAGPFAARLETLGSDELLACGTQFCQADAAFPALDDISLGIDGKVSTSVTAAAGVACDQFHGVT